MKKLVKETVVCEAGFRFMSLLCVGKVLTSHNVRH